MTNYITMLRKRFVTDQEQKKLRQEPEDPRKLAEEFSRMSLSDIDRAVRRLDYMLDHETPYVYPDEKIALIRTVPVVQEIFTKKEWQEIGKDHYIHEQGKVCNINPQYTLLLSSGFDAKREEINRRLRGEKDENKIHYLKALCHTLDSVQKFADRYRLAAENAGNRTVAESFSHIPANAPQTFLEALQFLRLLHYCLWASFNYHNTLGRFDQYMYPYYKKDMDTGKLDKGKALELVEEFFLSCNKDSDLYNGMQQGDNGQSMVLGGVNPDGTESYNDLSDICLQASLELKLIDPKINLRVNKKTPLSLYEKGTYLTKQGLGFPQYANDDVVIPCLEYWGYDEEDACNYVVAACWEFIIPGAGMDIPNINALSFADLIVRTLDRLPECTDFSSYLHLVHEELNQEAERLMRLPKNVYMEPAPMLSLMMQNTVRDARDISLGNKYNNYGFHGAGLSTAVDSLAAIKKYIFDDKTIQAQDMVTMCHDNFEGHEEIQNMLRYEAPKMGDDIDWVDSLADTLLGWYADAFEGRHNDRGGIFRAGTGSAMYYVWQSENEMATPDGRRKGEEYACNYSPSLFIRCDGPVSIIKSFTKPRLDRVSNGGPLTIELHDTLFRNEDSIRKVAMYIKSFIDMGGHQMQINAVNRDELLDAKAHPENHRNLIVRVWGWSGYFVELDECYQNHIIKRMELNM